MRITQVRCYPLSRVPGAKAPPDQVFQSVQASEIDQAVRACMEALVVSEISRGTQGVREKILTNIEDTVNALVP
jgi:hypothetical protein